MRDNEKEHKDTTVDMPSPGVKTEAQEVIAEIDRISQLLNDTKKIAEGIQKGVDETKRGVKWTKVGIVVAIIVSFVLFGVSTWLQYAKII